ncbi:tetratricopeptide repeat protein [Pelagibacterales bacterium SAG-MED14]|jgi:tetratricopeptide (TPR) repeat protein|nr:tetratricopeptide repeat protein [Pelagibacterales bacterium SAG-MED14]|tara:strand:+ start:2489 stop:3040 length:552 start_codon:yes stop_codon:yes gene_type:complete
MKKYYYVLFILIFSSLGLNAETTNTKLNELFIQLKECNSQKQSKILENKIWRLWETHPTNFQLTIDLKEGSRLVQNRNYLKAYNIFSKIIDKDPNWAEAWNRRATTLYLMGKHKNALKDIDIVLKLEKRHFGALIGKGQVYIEMKEYEKAFNSFLESSYINPMNSNTMELIPRISKLISEKII